ncbi:uncharacterized protein LOC144114605 [Amblyomma americanum]
MADGQRRFSTQRGTYQANFLLYPRGAPPQHAQAAVPMHKSESALSLSMGRPSSPIPPLHQRRGTICTSEVMRVESNTTVAPCSDQAMPPMAEAMMTTPPLQQQQQPQQQSQQQQPPATIRRSYMVTSFAEPPTTMLSGYGPCSGYDRPYSPAPPPRPPSIHRSSSARRSPVRRPRSAYGYDDYYDDRRRRNCDDDFGDDDYECDERSFRRAPQRSRSGRDVDMGAKSPTPRSGSRLRVMRIEREISDTGSARQRTPSASRGLSRGRLGEETEGADSCVCICGSARSPPSRGRLSGIYIKPRREEDEELYVIKRRRSRRKNKRKRYTPPPPPPSSPSQPGLVDYLCSLVGMKTSEEAPPTPPAPPPSAATDSDTEDDADYELKRLDRAELERLCRQIDFARSANASDKK